MKLRNKLLPLILLIVLLGNVACSEESENSEAVNSVKTSEALEATQEPTLDGLYEFIHPIGIIRPNDGSYPCSPHWEGMRGVCVQDYDATNSLGLKLLENGDLKFGTQLIFSNAHVCTLSGVAKHIENGWTYEETLDPEVLEEQEFPDEAAKAQFIRRNNCKLRIFMDEDIIVLNALPSANCRSHCGARGRFSHATFPTTFKVEDSISEEAIECIGVTSDDCKKLADPSE